MRVIDGRLCPALVGMSGSVALKADKRKPARGCVGWKARLEAEDRTNKL